MIIIDRIMKLIEYKDISIRKFEQKINASNGLISNANRKKTDIQSKWVSEIIYKFPDVNVEWLMTGRGEMLKTGRQEAVISAPVCFQSCCYISDLRYTIEVQKKLIGILNNANKSV